MHTAIIDLGFGDSGKGTMVDYYTKKYNAKTIVRFNGGGQAAHNVVLPDGRRHTFSQFGSGSFHGADTYLSEFTLFDPIALINEANNLTKLGLTPLKKLYVDKNAIIVTPYHRSANRLREILRGNNAHGSCGMGIGETVYDSQLYKDMMIKVSDINNMDLLRSKLLFFKNLKSGQFLFRNYDSELASKELNILSDNALIHDMCELLIRMFKDIKIVDTSFLNDRLNLGEVIFEGAQGTLLDELYGFNPYTTWSKTTTANVDSLLDKINYKGEINKIGVIRGYMTRHGNGPLPTETNELPLDTDNKFNDWQKHFRVGWLDLALIKYALSVNNGINKLAITCLDKVPNNVKVCTRYSNYDVGDIREIIFNNLDPVYVDIHKDELIGYIEQYLGVKVTVKSNGPMYIHKVEV